MLTIAGAFSYVDRQVLTVLVEPVRRDLAISDTQFGLLTGIFFFACFVVAGIPRGRLSDRPNRRTVIACAVAVWSLATMACGFAQSFLQLSIARSVVAIGEAGSYPAAASIVAGLFPPAQRARAFAVLSSGSAIGIAGGVLVGGVLSPLLGWRGVLIALGVPGLMFSGLLFLTVSDPPRSPAENPAAARLPFGKAAAGIARLPGYWGLAAIALFGSISGYGVLAWMPALLMRVHGMSSSSVGVAMSAAALTGLLGGNLLCGLLAHGLGQRDMRWLLRLPILGLAICVPAGVLTLTATSSAASCSSFCTRPRRVPGARWFPLWP